MIPFAPTPPTPEAAPRPAGLDEFVGVITATICPTAHLPVPFLRELTAYIEDLEATRDRLHANAATAADMIGRLESQVRIASWEWQWLRDVAGFLLSTHPE